MKVLEQAKKEEGFDFTGVEGARMASEAPVKSFAPGGPPPERCFDRGRQERAKAVELRLAYDLLRSTALGLFVETPAVEK